MRTSDIGRLTGMLLLLFIGMGSAKGQNCLQKLKQAEKLYEQGLIHLVGENLNGCLGGKELKRNDLVHAYKLLTLSCIYMVKQEEAEEAMLGLLKADPNFELTGNEPSEFVRLYKSFRTVPVFSVGVVGGLNQMDIEVTQRFKMDNFFRASGEYAPDPTVYNLDMGSYMGFQFGVHGDVLLKGRLHLHGEINFKTMRYNYADSMAFGNSLLSYAETQQVVSLPVGLKYNLRNKKIQPYLTLGAIPTGLLSAKSDVKRKIKTGLAAREITGAAVDVYDLRVNQYLLLYGGGGVKIKSMKGFIVLDYKQAYSLSNAVKPEMRYSEPTLVYKYGYIDDNFLFRNAMFSVGYIVSFYKPKILKRL